MKSVLMTFSQITGNVLTKACLVVLCVFVFSSMGSAQSFTNVDDARTKLKAEIKTMKAGNLESVGTTKVKATNELGQTGVVSVSTATQADETIKRAYYSKVFKYLPGIDSQYAVSTAIDEAHARMLDRNPNSATQLNAIKQEVTDLLSN